MKYKFIIIFFGLLDNIFLFSSNFPFPQFRNYPYGIKPTNFTNEEMYFHLQQTFLSWKQNYLTKSGAPQGTYRIQRASSNNYDTVSEGIGYGMLILVLTDNTVNNNRQYFDGLYRYYQCYLDSYGLMNWQIDKEGNIIGYNAATDADEDVALALIFAHYQWGSKNSSINYLEEAKKVIQRIMDYQVEKPGYILKPGDGFGGSDLVNPSYFAMGWYRVFKKVTQNTNWDKVIDSCYSILEIFKNTETGLVPDWCDVQGKEVSGQSYNYSYDACRVPWRVGMDYLWYGEQRAYQINHKITSWLMNSTENNVDNLVSGYKLDGTKIVYYSNAAFIGPFGVGSMIDENFQNWCNALYNKLKNYPNGGQWGYYQDCLKMLTMLAMTGNFINYLEEQPTNFTIPTCQIISPTEDEIISGKLKIVVSANSEKYNLNNVKLFFNDTLLYEQNLSSKNVNLVYNWDTSSIVSPVAGVLKSVVYDINGSSYTYFVNIMISPPSEKQQDGTGKVLISPDKVPTNKSCNFVLTYYAQSNISLGEILIKLPDNIQLNQDNINIYAKYGSPVLSGYSCENDCIKINLFKISNGEILCIELNNVFIPNEGIYNFVIKTRTNGGVLKEIINQPYVKAYALNEQSETKFISLNKDYKNDVIIFNSKNVSIFDSKGRKIIELKNNNVWDGKSENGKFVSSGLYFYKESNGNTGRIIIVK